MTADLLFRLCMGHLMGDYLLQINWMALNKKEKGWTGWIAAAWHCILWTLCVSLWMFPELAPLVAIYPTFIGTLVLIFASHWILDRYGFIEWWLHKIGSRSYHLFLDKFVTYDPEGTNHYPDNIHAAAYTAIVQTVADNTLHVLFVYLIVKYMVL